MVAGIVRPTTTCPAGKLAVGGGFDPAFANSHELVGTHPTADGTGWTTMNAAAPCLDHLQEVLGDRRSRRVIFVSHCILNENVRYLGGVSRAGSVTELVGGFQDGGVGIYQMPCPEQRAWGGVLKRYLLVAYGSKETGMYRFRRPLTRLFLWHTRLVYARLARRVLLDVADYVRSGFEVVGVLIARSLLRTHAIITGRVLRPRAASPAHCDAPSHFHPRP